MTTDAAAWQPTIQLAITTAGTIAVAYIGWQQYREKAKRDKAVARIEAAAQRQENTCEAMETQVTALTKAQGQSE